MTLVFTIAPLDCISARRAFVLHSFRSWRPRWSAAALLLCAALLWHAQPALAQFVQEGNKLVGTGVIGAAAQQGSSVALSADGNTAIVGGSLDNSSTGAVWVFTRSAGVWTQQGNKLVGTGAAGTSFQGVSVALSADGNTAIVGGSGDSGNVGAAWVFHRSAGVWTQQGNKLVGTGVVGSPAQQGVSVALSADGNTAIVGGLDDNNTEGAAWVFTRSGVTWTQQGSKLVGTGAVTGARQGTSVALSADGNTALVGGRGDNNEFGATWVFTRSGVTWTQQGDKLVGTGAIGAPRQGISVALSGDGNTAIVGGSSDDSNAGATWTFTRSGTVWSQQGNKLVGSGAVGGARQGFRVALSIDGSTALVGGFTDNANVGATWVFVRSGSTWIQVNKLIGTGASGAGQQGFSVALSDDGKTAIAGGPFDNSSVGAAWVFIRATATHDFDADNKSDIVWRQNGTGTTAIWLMNGAAISSSAVIGTVPTSWQIVGQREFGTGGRHDLLWRDTSTGGVAMWFMNGTSIVGGVSVATVPTIWTIVGTGDANGDNRGDILWRNTADGSLALWLMNGAIVTSAATLGSVATDWQVAAMADFTGNGKANILWRNTSSGVVALWILNGTSVTGAGSIGAVDTSWSIVATGDFNGDRKADIVWRDATGNTAIWLMNGATVLSAGSFGTVPTDWIVAETGDFNGDGKSDILWRNTTTGDTAMWFMNGVALSSSASLGVVGTDWVIQRINAN